jgi:tetratricopeptide (TPR) repeat protein
MASAVVIAAISGMAGVGKTALAVHWAHRVVAAFPDGQLYVNLRGFDPGDAVMAPAEAIRGFLDAFGVPPERIPTSPDALAGLYRSLLAGRRVLVVLDNARDSEQVRPLLPGSPGCMAVVTSRERLSSLVVTAGAHPLTLDVFTFSEAREMLLRRLDARRTADGPAATVVEQIVARCARLPLALAVVAARAAVRLDFSMDQLAAELDQAADGVDAFDTGDAASSVGAVFSWSYRALSSSAARMFRLLALHPGPDIAVPAAASLTGQPLTETRLLLADLSHRHLVDEQSPARYTFHDLLRAYAGHLAHTVDTDMSAASRRLLDHYLHSAYTAAKLLHPHRETMTLDAPATGVQLADLADHTEALAWLTAEHRALLALVERAAATGFDAYAWQLASSLSTFLDRQGRWRDYAETQRIALAAATRRGDQSAIATAHRHLGWAHALSGRLDEGERHQRQAIDLYREIGDRTGQALSHLNLGWVFERQGRLREALAHVEQAVELYRASGDVFGLAIALSGVGWFHTLLGDPAKALVSCREALRVQQRIGDRYGEGDAWDSLGYAYHHLGQYDQATDCYEQALALFRVIGDRHREADTLTHRGDTRCRNGDALGAHHDWEQALIILDEFGDPDADKVRAKLRRSSLPEQNRGGA